MKAFTSKCQFLETAGAVNNDPDTRRAKRRRRPWPVEPDSYNGEWHARGGEAPARVVLQNRAFLSKTPQQPGTLDSE